MQVKILYSFKEKKIVQNTSKFDLRDVFVVPPFQQPPNFHLHGNRDTVFIVSMIFQLTQKYFEPFFDFF